MVDGPSVVVELSVRPVLAGVARRALGSPTHRVLSAHVADQGPRSALEALGEAWVAGVDVDWEAVLAGGGATRIDLPQAPWQRRRCWVDERAEAEPPELEPDPVTPSRTAVGRWAWPVALLAGTAAGWWLRGC
ncbi:MAG: hypothetical protein H6732_18390 [Alphaproteobacteria bacterium]|nr:hypothetical protein [Alphaproteobacteria bacterium]